MVARRSDQEFDQSTRSYMYPRSMVIVIQDCLNTVCMSEKQLRAGDFKTRLTLEHLRANWLTSVGD
eukprot:333019-Alexandrium_andersonii.AAC.1